MVEVSPKSFRIKGLRLLSLPNSPTEPESSLNQIRIKYKSNSNQFSTASQLISKPKPYDKLFTNIFIIEIVKDSSGITATDINTLLTKRIKRGNYYNPPDNSHSGYINSMLRNLINKGVLTRIKINDVYHYYFKVQ